MNLSFSFIPFHGKNLFEIWSFKPLSPKPYYHIYLKIKMVKNKKTYHYQHRLLLYIQFSDNACDYQEICPQPSEYEIFIVLVLDVSFFYHSIIDPSTYKRCKDLIAQDSLYYPEYDCIKIGKNILVSKHTDKQFCKVADLNPFKPLDLSSKT